MAPIHSTADVTPLRVCVLVADDEQSPAGPFLLLRESPLARVYLGAVSDAGGRIQDWIEIWVQSAELRDFSFSNYQERLTNPGCDQRWLAEYELARTGAPESVVVTGMEKRHPQPLLIQRPEKNNPSPFLTVETTPWRVCQDDTLLSSLGLPPFSTSSFRYLYDPSASGDKTLLTTAADAPAAANTRSSEQQFTGSKVRAVFNPHAGLVRVMRFPALALEEHLQVLEGCAWDGIPAGKARLTLGGIYDELQTWSVSQKGGSFLLHATGSRSDQLHEALLLKLALWQQLFKAVRASVKAQQLPLLNLTPASFRVSLSNTGGAFPSLWSASAALVKPGQAFPLNLKATEQRYFVRLGRTEPSPFLPETLGAHSFGIGSIRLRSVNAVSDGTCLEGTLVAEEYLRLNPNDLLWFQLPLAEGSVEFYAHVHRGETVGPKEARFRSVPTRLPEAALARLNQSSGAAFPKAPYEIWPLLSSPCDLYSLGIIGVRLLLANRLSNLPVIVDDVLSLTRSLCPEPTAKDELLPQLKTLLANEPKLLALVSPHALLERDCPPDQARAHINLDLWLDAVCLLLRLFPGAGHHSYCRDFGDVSPLALETVFDQPLNELELLLLRLRSVLLPSLSANEEIANVLRERLQKV